MKKIVQLCSIATLFFLFNTRANTPQICIVIVVDQLTYYTLEKIRSYLNGGLRFFLDEGIIYKQALAEIGQEHATLNTGVAPRIHGIINNSWYENNQKVACNQDTIEKAAVFGPQGLQPYAKSSAYLMVDGLSDQLCLQTDQHKDYKVFAISGNSRSATCAAGKLGKAIWFDHHTGMITTSKAYYDQLPHWIAQFNKTKHSAKTNYTWNLYHACLPQAYAFKHAHNYKGAQINQSLIGQTMHPNAQEQYKQFMACPAANKLVFDVALACIDEHFCRDHADEKLFLWVLPSGLGKLSNLTGPNSIEVIDMIYHLDNQIKRFINAVNCKTRKRNILWCLTSNHSTCPLPEQMQQDGYTSARRIITTELVNTLNQLINKEYAIAHLVTAFNGNNIHIDQPLFKTLKKETRNNIKKLITTYLQAQPGIKKVWTFKQLQNMATESNSIERYYQNQLFKGRTGKFIVCVYPYTHLTAHTTGINDVTAYNYNAHIPLIIYQRAFYHRKIIDEAVSNTQLAPTLAHILQVPKPSACTAQVLPGIFFKEDCCF